MEGAGTYYAEIRFRGPLFDGRPAASDVGNCARRLIGLGKRYAEFEERAPNAERPSVVGRSVDAGERRVEFHEGSVEMEVLCLEDVDVILDLITRNSELTVKPSSYWEGY